MASTVAKEQDQMREASFGPDRPRGTLRRLSTPGLTAVALALVAALALAALGSRGSPWASGPSPGRISAGWLDVVFTLAVLAGLLVLALAAYSAWPGLRRPRKRKDDLEIVFERWPLLWSDRVVLGLLFAAVIGGIVAIVLVGKHLGQTAQTQSGAGPARPVPSRVQPPPPPEHPASGVSIEWPVVWGGLAAVALGSAAAFAVVRARRRRGPAATEPSAPPELIAALDDSLDDLERDPDARRAVIRAYARMERALADGGAPRRPAEAPFEYLGRVLRELRAGDREARELTDLFALAKFSRHPIGAGMKERAISALGSLRAQLRGSG
jgi:hypothetical protein